jgi:hypothetical protein
MSNELSEVITKIGKAYENDVSEDGRNYLEVDMNQEAEKLGLPRTESQFAGVHVVIPLKGPRKGMKVRIDGRTFVNYAQFDSGIAVPEYVAKETGLHYKTYHAKDSMILNFS